MKFDFTDQIKQKSDEELTEIFIHAKDYNPDFVRLAEDELSNRNINLDSSKQIREEVKEFDRKQLQEGKPGSPLYIFFCFVLALLGGIIAIYAGYIYSRSKIKTKDGDEFYVYNSQTRELGKMMMWLGFGVFIFLLLKKLFTT